MVKAAIVQKWKFVSSKNRTFSKYIDYIDRDEATRTKEFKQYNLLSTDGYNHYMEDPEKSSGLFTSKKNQLTSEERRQVKKEFLKAQKNDSIMWQDVVSFDTNWLIEQELYNPEEKVLNEPKIMNAVRAAMKEQLNREGLANSAIWTAAIHYNELHHIHVHIAIVEPNPTREYKTFSNKDGSTYQARRGSRSKKSIDRFRSQVASQLLDRDEPLARISSLIRNGFGKQTGNFSRTPSEELQYLYGKIYHSLPPDTRTWKYNMNALQEVRPLINRFIDTYVQTYDEKPYKELQLLLKENARFYERVYGTGTKEADRANDFITNKNEELYAKLGNALLKEMREQYKLENQGKARQGQPNWQELIYQDKPTVKPIKADLGKIKKAFRKDFESMKNQQIYLKNLQRQQQEKQGPSR